MKISGCCECDYYNGSRFLSQCTLQKCAFAERPADIIVCDECVQHLHDDEDYIETEFGDFCIDCAEQMVTYDNARLYLLKTNHLCNFMFYEIYDSDEPEKVSDRLRDAMLGAFNRCVANDRILGKKEFLEHLRKYLIKDDKYDAVNYINFVHRMKLKEAK